MRHFFEEWLDNQDSRSINEEVIEIFEESIKCYKIGAYRAAIVMAFNGFQIVIKNRIIYDKEKMITELTKNITELEEIKTNKNKLDNYKNLKKQLEENKLDDENKWEDELRKIIDGDRFNIAFNISNQNTIYKEWEIWRSRRNTGAHGKSYKLISADVESFYSWIIQSLNILYPFTHINNILDEIDKYFSNNYEYSNDKPVNKLLNDILILENDNLNKILDRIYNYYNNRNDKRILYIFKNLLYNEKNKKNVSNFFLDKLKELESEENSNDIIILDLLLDIPDIIYAFYCEDRYVFYSKIINRFKTCIFNINDNKQKELMSILVNILLKNNKDIKNAIEDNIIKNNVVGSRLIIFFLYNYYTISKDSNLSNFYDYFKDSINIILKSYLMTNMIDNIFIYDCNYPIYDKEIFKEIIYKLINLSDENNLLTSEIIQHFSYSLKEYLYSNRNNFSNNTKDILYDINIKLFDNLTNSTKSYYDHNDTFLKIFWKYLTHDEVKYFVDIMNINNFIYDYYVTYEYFTERLSNEYKDKYPDIDFSIIENGRKKALEFCKRKNNGSNCGFDTNINQ